MTALSLISCSPGREAPRTLRERLECSEGGDTGRRTRESYGASHKSHARPSVQPPAGVERKPALYAARPERQETALPPAELDGRYFIGISRLDINDITVSFARSSAAKPKFAQVCGALGCELRTQKRHYRIELLVSLSIPKFAQVCGALGCELRVQKRHYKDRVAVSLSI